MGFWRRLFLTYWALQAVIYGLIILPASMFINFEHVPRPKLVLWQMAAALLPAIILTWYLERKNPKEIKRMDKEDRKAFSEVGSAARDLKLKPVDWSGDAIKNQKEELKKDLKGTGLK